MVLGVNWTNNTIERDAVASRSLRKSASADHGRIEQLWNQIRIGHLVTVTVHTGIKFVRKIFNLNVTLGLCFSAESYNFKHEAIMNFTRGKFHGIEINDHVSIL